MRIRTARRQPIRAARSHLATLVTALTWFFSSAYFAALIGPESLYVRSFVAAAGLVVVAVIWVYVFRPRWPRWRVLALTAITSTVAGTLITFLLPTAGPVVALAAGFVTLALCASPWPGMRLPIRRRRNSEQTS